MTLRFTADEIQFYSTNHHISIFEIGYGWFSAVIIILLLAVAFLHLSIYALISPNNNATDKISFTDALRQIERESKPSITTTSIMGAHLLDKTLNKRQEHDHNLGSYWSDHDDDGNYDPGAWRRKYDKKQ